MLFSRYGEVIKRPLMFEFSLAYMEVSRVYACVSFGSEHGLFTVSVLRDIHWERSSRYTEDCVRASQSFCYCLRI